MSNVDITSILVEDLVMRMAAEARINVAPHTLQTDEQGVMQHIVERNIYGRRRVLLPITELSTLVADESNGSEQISCETLAKAVAKSSTTPKLDVVNLFEQLYFAWLIGDTQFGVERVRMVRSQDGYSSLAPTTLFTSSRVLNTADEAEVVILINSKQREISSSDFVESMQRCGLQGKVAENMIAKFSTLIDLWCDMIEASDIDEEVSERFKFMLFLRG